MKYVKGISLFFVYPACCFIFGLMFGFIIYENRDSKAVAENNEVKQNVVVEQEQSEEYESGRQEENPVDSQNESMPGQYVMNPNALQEIPGTEPVGESNGYFITIAEDCVIVYHGDKETIFLTTDIRAAKLPKDVQEDLKSWMYVADEGMLYDFLENYTS